MDLYQIRTANFWQVLFTECFPPLFRFFMEEDQGAKTVVDIAGKRFVKAP